MVKTGFRQRFNKHYLFIRIFMNKTKHWLNVKKNPLILRLIKTELMSKITPVPLLIPRTISRSCQCHKTIANVKTVRRILQKTDLKNIRSSSLFLILPINVKTFKKLQISTWNESNYVIQINNYVYIILCALCMSLIL